VLSYPAKQRDFSDGQMESDERLFDEKMKRRQVMKRFAVAIFVLLLAAGFVYAKDYEVTKKAGV
jgi:hypothetical protein